MGIIKEKRQKEIKMCTAISHKGIHHLFGRTLDLEYSYGESIVISPKCFPFSFIHEKGSSNHPSIIGVACVRDGFPLYYDAMNECGLAMAGLNFPDITKYHKKNSHKHGVAAFELIPWVLCNCKNLDEALALLRDTVITDDSFSPEMPCTPLHWMIADHSGSAVIECEESGMKIYENPFGILTNSPSFPYHRAHLCDFLQLSSVPAQNNICPDVKLSQYSRGLGGVGLPGDFSSASRFVRAVFAESHTEKGNTPTEEISRFFHIMDILSVPSGCIKTNEDKSVRTVYTSCADTEAKTYYFTTYSCRRISAVSLKYLRSEKELVTFPLERDEDILHLQ